MRKNCDHIANVSQYESINPHIDIQPNDILK